MLQGLSILVVVGAACLALRHLLRGGWAGRIYSGIMLACLVLGVAGIATAPPDDSVHSQFAWGLWLVLLSVAGVTLPGLGALCLRVAAPGRRMRALCARLRRRS